MKPPTTDSDVSCRPDNDRKTINKQAQRGTTLIELSVVSHDYSAGFGKSRGNQTRKLSHSEIVSVWDHPLDHTLVADIAFS